MIDLVKRLRVLPSQDWRGTAYVYPPELVKLTNEAADEIERLKAALTQIGAWNDAGANAHLNKTGSYSKFDEPASVKIARAALLH